MKGQYRGWVIIGFDLLFVLGIFFLYTQFVVEPSANSVRLEDTLRYDVKVSPHSGDTIPIRLTVSNPSSESRTVKLPEGLVLFLTTGRETDGTDHFWADRPISPGPLTLDSGETRQWRFNPRVPPSRPSPLYVAFYIDDDRQEKVMVPE